MDDETREVIARAELPKLFRNIRIALGLSQEKLSELSGISRVQISYYETADSVPTMATFNKWLLAVTREIGRLRENKWGNNAKKEV
jgi:transcriptional regulator with XRE-family HTH domain